MRLAACLALPLAAWTFACESTLPEPGLGGQPAPPASPDAGPPLPTVMLPGTTRPSSAQGMCTSWSSAVLDLSSLPAAQRTFVHGVDGGFSVVAAPASPSRVAALALDATGEPRAAEVDLPVESTAVADAIATSEGGWLAAWSSGSSEYYPCGGALSFVHYDAAGTPTGRTASQTAGSGFLGAEPGGMTDVAWCTSDPAWSSQLGTVSALPFGLSSGASFATGLEESFLGWRQGTLLSIECPQDGSCDYGFEGLVLRTWSPSGQAILGAVLPDDLASAMSTGAARASPGFDPSTAIVAQASGVSFVSASQVLFVPSDLLLNAASPWPSSPVAGASRAVVGFDGHIGGDGDGGGDDALQIVEVSAAGGRSVVGTAPLPPDPARNLAESTLTLAATLAEDAYVVVLVGPSNVEGAVFTCTGRAS